MTTKKPAPQARKKQQDERPAALGDALAPGPNLDALRAQLQAVAVIHNPELPAPNEEWWDTLTPRMRSPWPRIKPRIGRHQPCLVCSLPENLQVKAWRVYTSRDVQTALAFLHGEGETVVTLAELNNHYVDHHQPQPLTPPLPRDYDHQHEVNSADPRWAAIIRCVHRQRVLSGDQIRRLFFREEALSPIENAALAGEVLRRLTGGYYLYEYRHRVSHGRQHLVYFLNRAGGRFIHGETGESPPVVAKLEDVPKAMIEHDTSSAEIFITLREQASAQLWSARDEEWQLPLSSVNWYGERNLTFQYQDIRRERMARIQPDGFASLGAISSEHSHCLPFYYEFDRGSRDVEDVIEQVANYIAFAVTRQTMQRFPGLSAPHYHPPLLFVVRRAERVQQLIDGVQELTKEIPEEVRPVALIISEAKLLESAWAPGAWESIWRHVAKPEQLTLLDALLGASTPLFAKPNLDARSILKIDRHGAAITTAVSKR